MKNLGIVSVLLFSLNTLAVSHLENAQALLHGVLPENSRYQHGEQIVTWADPQTKTPFMSFSDCSGLISAILSYTYKLNSDDFKAWLGKKRPVASTYHQAIKEQNRFQIIDLSLAQPGDFVAIEYRDGSANTGHIMILSSVPKIRSSSDPRISNFVQWELKVIDSALSGHGNEDTRFDKKLNRFRNGIGEGTMRIYTDDYNTIMGYSWSLSPQSQFYQQNNRHLVIGRFKE